MSFENGAGRYRGLRLVNDVAPFMYNMSRVQSISSSDTDYLLSVYDLRDSQRMGSYFLSELDTGQDIAHKYQSDKYSYADFMAAAVNAFEHDDVYNQADATGFINLFGLPLKVRALMQEKTGK